MTWPFISGTFLFVRKLEKWLKNALLKIFLKNESMKFYKNCQTIAEHCCQQFGIIVLAGKNHISPKMGFGGVTDRHNYREKKRRKCCATHLHHAKNL